MIKLAPTKCNHCSNTLFIVFDYLENCLVLQCNQCKMVYGHQYNIGLYELNQSEKDSLNESEGVSNE